MEYIIDIENGKDTEEYVKELLSPEPLGTIEELSDIIKPLPRYVGPGLWLSILK